MSAMKLDHKLIHSTSKGRRFFSTGLPSDVTVEVGEQSFHLHKFPLLSKSGLIEKLIREKSDEGEECCAIQLHDIPGGSKVFELIAKFCYGVKLEMTASNVIYLRCAAEHLKMTEEVAEGNLINLAEVFLNQVVLGSWGGSIKALQTCDSALPLAEDLQIVKRCIESLVMKSSTDPNLFGWPVLGCGPMQSPGGSILWNGISTGAKPRNSSFDWWYEDVSTLTLPLYTRLISVMESHGIRQDIISGSIAFYAKRHLPGLSRHRSITKTSIHLEPPALTASLSEKEQRHLVEEIDKLLPLQKGMASTELLFRLLRTSMILQASPSCISNLERRIGMQLDQAKLEDLLIPNFSHSVETLYDVDCVQRIVEQFAAFDQATYGTSPGFVHDEQYLGSPSLTPITLVAKLIDGYLAEVASDVNLKLSGFRSLAASVPDYARPLDDGLYRAIDIYLKAHSWLAEFEREELCRLVDFQKLSLEACTHVAQNERLPLRAVVQVLFFEQLQLRSSIAGCFLVSDNFDASRPLSELSITGRDGECAPGAAESKVLKAGMESMRLRVSQLEKECSKMREEIEKLIRGKNGWSVLRRMLGSNVNVDKPKMCSVQKREKN